MRSTPHTIEQLRNSLYLAAQKYSGNLLHPTVVQISKELDKHIVEWTLAYVSP